MAGYLHFLGASKTVISLLPALSNTIAYLAQLLSLQWIRPERGRFRRVLLVYLLCPMGYLVLGLSSFYLPAHADVWRIVTCFACHAFFNFFVSLGDPHYVSMAVEITSPHKRGRFFGWKFVLTGLGGVMGGALCSWVLRILEAPADYTTCFLLAGALIFLSVVWFAMFREIGLPSQVEQPEFRELLASGIDVIRRNRSFAVFLVWQVLIMLMQGVYPLLAVYIQERLGAPEAILGQLTMCVTVSHLSLALLFGWTGDHFGHRQSLRLIPLLFLAGVLLMVRATHPLAAFAGFFLCSCWLPATSTSATNYALQLLPGTQPAKVWAALTVVGAPFRTIAYLVAGFGADRWSYGTVFKSSAVFGIAALLVSLFVLPNTGEGSVYRRGRPRK